MRTIAWTLSFLLMAQELLFVSTTDISFSFLATSACCGLVGRGGCALAGGTAGDMNILTLEQFDGRHDSGSLP